MNLNISNRSALALVSLLAALVVAACSNYSAPTTPYGGGDGGGGAGARFNLGPFGLGQSVELTFASAGTFGYHCIPHRSMGMTGIVQVDDGGSDSLVVRITGDLQFAPSTAHIKPGGHVRWLNASNRTDHTVTSD
jgi:hypothetical protein